MRLNTADQSARFPEVALLSDDAFQDNAPEGTVHHIDAAQSVVDAQIAVFVGTKGHAVAELLVEVSGGDGKILGLITYKIIGYALSFIVGTETQHGAQVAFIAQSGAEIAIGVEYVGTGIGEQFLRHVFGADDGVAARNLAVQLNVAGHLSAQQSLCHDRGTAGHGQGCQQ